MMKLTDFDLPAVATEGVWFDYVDKFTAEPWDGVRVKLASADLDEFRRLLAKPIEEFAAKRAQSGRSVALPSEQLREQALINALANKVLLDWEGVVDEATPPNPLPCTLQNRLIALKKRRFRESIEAMALDIKAFEQEAVLDSSNSPKSTSS